MSPLAEAIYHVLGPRVGLKNPLISYHDLVKKLPPLGPPHADITRNDPRLYQALSELGKACQALGFPNLAALVVRSQEQTPGSGYYQAAHPEAGDDPASQRDAWERELVRVKATTYPTTLGQGPAAGPDASGDDRQWSRPLGHLRLADGGARPTLVFAGRLACPRCAADLAVEVERNPSAISAKQPAFVVVETGAPAGGRPLGHLFIGTILSSPVLYYGAFHHCGSEHRLAVFFNRAIRDRSDHHLTVMPSTSAQPGSAPGEVDPFKLS